MSMKTKLLLILLTAFFTTSINAAANETRKRNIKFQTKEIRCKKKVSRSLLNYGIDVNDNSYILQILFNFPLSYANIHIEDKNGNTIINEHQTLIQEGRIIYIYSPDAYPYTLEITSSTVDTIGEITLEEEY